MTTDSHFNNRCRWQFPRDLNPEEMVKHTNEATGAVDMVKRDRFELLSAYLDGEVTAAERRQVENWLAEDEAVQRLYARLLKLRQGVRTMPVPAAPQSPEITANQVFARVNRRSRLVWTLSGAAIAACVIGVVSGWLPGREAGVPQLAKQPVAQPTPVATKPVAPTAAPLMVALNNPVIEIPKAAIASPQKPANSQKPRLGEVNSGIN